MLSEKDCRQIDAFFKEEILLQSERLDKQLRNEAQALCRQGLESEEMAYKRLKSQFDVDYRCGDLVKSIVDGFLLIQKSAETELSTEERLEYLEEVEKVQKTIENRVETEVGSNSSDGTCQNFYQISDGLMNLIHKIAYSLYQKRQYEEALRVYKILALLNPLYVDYHTSLAIVSWELGQQNEAIFYQTIAAAFDVENPTQILKLCDYQLTSGYKEMAKDTLEKVDALLGQPNADHNFTPYLNSLKKRLHAS